MNDGENERKDEDKNQQKQKYRKFRLDNIPSDIARAEPRVRLGPQALPKENGTIDYAAKANEPD